MRYLDKIVFDKLKKLKGRTLAIISIVGLLGAVVAASLVQKELSLRSKAVLGSAVLTIVPSSQERSVGETGNVNISLNPNGYGVSGVELIMQYDSGKIEINDIQPGDFFTSYADGDPVEIIENISEPGEIHYAIAFPLGSVHTSTDVKNAAVISFTTKNIGSSSVDFVVEGLSRTKVTDVDGNDILYEALGGTINIFTAAALYFSNPTPTNPQVVGEQFSVSVLADTGGKPVSAIDAKINFDANILEVRNIDQGTEPGFVSYPALEYDNQLGTVTISANIGTSSSPQPVSGPNINVGTIGFYVKNVTSASNITYDYTPGGRNDSNIVLSGTAGDSVDILSSVGSLEIVAEGQQVPTCTDTDGGIDYYVKGTVTSTECGGPQVDYCEGDNVREQYCGAQAQCLVAPPYTCQYGCTDGACNLEPVPPDNESPNVSFREPIDGQKFIVGENFDVIADAGDVDGTISSVELYVDGNSAGTRTQSPYVWTYIDIVKYTRLIGLPAGSHGFRVVATDDKGATSDASITIIIEEAPQQSVNVKLSFEGRMYSGADRAKAIVVEYVDVKDLDGGTHIGPLNFNTNSLGEFALPIAEGWYNFLIDAPGYLARVYRNVIIRSGSPTLILSGALLGGDFNDDGEINEVDYTLKFMPSFNGADAVVDLDGSGMVTGLDYGIMRENWNLIDDVL